MGAPIRKCWGCSREVVEPATLCEACSPARVDPSTAADGQPEAGVPQARAGVTILDHLTRRDWALILLGAAGAGIVTLGLLTSRAAASPGALAPHATPAAPSPASVVVPAAPKWSSDNRSRWVGDARKTAAFDLEADNRVQIWTRQVRPTLVVRCASKAIEVFVFTESAARIEPGTDDHTVRYAFDDEPEHTERWADSDDHDGLFAPDSAGFADRLVRATTLRFAFTPHNAPLADVQFSVTGLGPLLEPVAADCGRPTPTAQ